MKTVKSFILALLALICISHAEYDRTFGATNLNAVQQYLKLSGDGHATAGFQITGTWSATITFESTVDDSTWVAVSATNRASGASATTTTSNGIYNLSATGVRSVRARVSAYTSGTAVVTPILSSAALASASGGGAGDASAANQTSGDQKTQIVDGSGNVIGSTSNALDVNIKSGAGSGGTAMTDDAAFTPATTSVTPIAGFADETGPDAVDEGDAGAVRMTLQRGLHINPRNSSGTEIGTAAAPFRVDPTGTTAQPITDNSGSITVDYATTGSGTATGALRVELPTNGTGVLATVGAVTSITNTVTIGGTAAADAAVSGNPVYTAGRASAAAPADVSADGDVVPEWRLRNGAAATVLTAAGALVGGDATNGLDVDVTRMNDGGNSITVDNAGTFAVQAGQVSDGSAASGNPVTVGGVARSTDPTAESSGDAVSLMTTTTKKLVTMPYALPGERWTYAAASGGIVNTTGVTIKAAVAGQKNCLTAIDIENGHASVSTEVVLRDGASGTVLKRWWAQYGGGGLARKIDPPVCGTTNTLLEVAAITTGSAIYVNAEGYEGDE